MMNHIAIAQQRLTEAETSHYIAMSRPWLKLSRMRGKGPAYLKIGRSVRYDIKDLDQWLQAHRVDCQ